MLKGTTTVTVADTVALGSQVWATLGAFIAGANMSSPSEEETFSSYLKLFDLIGFALRYVENKKNICIL